MIYTHIVAEDVVDARFLNLTGHLQIQTTTKFVSGNRPEHYFEAPSLSS